MKHDLFRYSCLFLLLFTILVGLGCISAADTGSNTTDDTSSIIAGTASQDNTDVISGVTRENKQVSLNTIGKDKKTTENNTKNLKNDAYNLSEDMYSSPDTRHSQEYRYNNSSVDDNFNNYYPNVEFYKEQGDSFFKNVSINSYDDIKSTIDNTDQYLLIINLENGTYTSTGNITADNVMHNYIINGNNQTVDGNQSQLLSIGSGSSFVLNNIQIINAGTTDNDVIYNNGTLIINNSVLTGNNATSGGIIYNQGTLIINNSVITNNNALGRGIIYNKGKVLINNSVLSNNNAINSSVVYNNQGVAVINNSSLSDNTAVNGSAIYNIGGNLLIDNSQLTGNHATRGGAVYNEEYISREDSQIHISSTLTITNTKFINNTDNMHELIYDNYTNTSNTLIIENNTYTGNYLKTSTNTKPENKNLNNTDYTIIIQIKTGSIYNTTINTGTVNIAINNKLYRKVPVKDNKAVITIPVEDFPNNINNITYTYNSPDNSYQPLTLENMITINKTYITADNIEAQLGNKITINATIRNSDNKTIVHGKIAVKINGKTFGYTNITSNGQIRYNLELTPEKFGKYTYKVTIVYGGTQNTPSAHKTIQLKIIPYRTIIELPETISYLTDTTVFNVKVTNQTGYNARSGNIGFKINGITYKVNKKAYIVKLNNGTAALEFNTSRKYVGKNNITITYSGNSQFSSARITFTDIYIVENSNRTVINTHPVVSKIGENITLTAKFMDKNNNLLPRGKVAVKINGRTFGYSQIINGTAAYTQYLNPTKFSGKKYIITYTFGGINKYSPARINTTLTINKLLPEITYNTTTINNTTSIIIKIKNSNINANSGTIGLKINQKTIKKENKTYILKPVNGTVTFTLNNTDISNKNLTITYSGNNLFYNGRITYNNGQQVQNTTRITSLFVQRQEKITDKTVNTWIENGITDVYVQAQASANDTKLLENVITLTNNTDIKVHAWIICFYKDKKFNLNVSQQNMIENFVSKVVQINGLSGVCLDYVRYDGKNQSVVNQSLITNFVKSVNTIIKQYNKSIELAACLFPEKTATAKYYGQNYTALSPYLDVELIMAYKYDYNKNSTWLKDVTSYVVRNAPYSRVVTVLQTYDREYKLLSDIELVDDIEAVINSGSDGYGLFRYGLVSNYPIDARRIPC